MNAYKMLGKLTPKGSSWTFHQFHDVHEKDENILLKNSADDNVCYDEFITNLKRNWNFYPQTTQM